MKITIEENGEKFTYDSGYDCSMHMTELTEKLYGLCVAAGYHPDSVGECFYDKGKEATEHLFKDDEVTSEDTWSYNINTTDDCESVVVTSRYGDERIFKILDDDTIEYSFKDTDYVRYSSNRDDDTLTLVDCAGGPCVSVGMDLGSIHTDLEGIVVKKINVNGGSHLLIVGHE